MLKRVGTKTHARVDIVGKHNNKNALAHVHISQNLDNGAICTLGDFMTGELMAREAVDVTGTTKREDIVMLKAPEIVADESSKEYTALKYFYNQAGEIVRGYYLKDLDKIHVSAEAIDPIDGSTALAVGQYIVPSTGFKMKASSSPANAIGKIVAKNTENVKTYYDATTKDFIGNSYDMFYIELL